MLPLGLVTRRLAWILQAPVRPWVRKLVEQQDLLSVMRTTCTDIALIITRASPSNPSVPDLHLTLNGSSTQHRLTTHSSYDIDIYKSSMVLGQSSIVVQSLQAQQTRSILLVTCLKHLYFVQEQTVDATCYNSHNWRRSTSAYFHQAVLSAPHLKWPPAQMLTLVM